VLLFLHFYNNTYLNNVNSDYYLISAMKNTTNTKLKQNDYVGKLWYNTK